MATYEVLEEYVHSQRAAIDAQQPIVLEVRDVETFERLTVRARVAPPGSALADSHELVLRDLAENVAAADWRIVILEEIDPDSADIRPQSDFRKSAPDGV
ncbi:MAG: hypothetical protein IT495_19255 [Gammaproteobacteria bacterium]|nr:hypothetical protein [Gammaproteobacteria bacterium]